MEGLNFLLCFKGEVNIATLKNSVGVQQKLKTCSACEQVKIVGENKARMILSP